MKKQFALVIALVAMVALSAFDQPQSKTLTITLSIDEANTVITALRKLPYDQSAEVIGKIVAQAQTQLQDTTSKKK